MKTLNSYDAHENQLVNMKANFNPAKVTPADFNYSSEIVFHWSSVYLFYYCGSFQIKIRNEILSSIFRRNRISYKTIRQRLQYGHRGPYLSSVNVNFCINIHYIETIYYIQNIIICFLTHLDPILAA